MKVNKSTSIEQKGFEALGKSSEKIGKAGAPVMERVFRRWMGHTDDDNWAEDAEWYRVQQEPAKARAILYAMLFAVIALIVWAANAPLDEVTRGEGKVIPSQQIQKIQSLDGGIVTEINVREGDRVEINQLLLKIDPTRANAGLGENQANFFSTLAEVTRLQAQINNENEPQFSEELQSEAPELVQQELSSFFSNMQGYRQQVQVIRDQLSQRQQNLREAQAAKQQHEISLQISEQELRVTRPLLQAGAVSEVDILRLERDINNLQGEINQTDAVISRNNAEIREARNRISETELGIQNQWRAQLSEASARLSALTRAREGLTDIVEQTEIRSSVNGVIQRNFYNTVGGVVRPGDTVVEIIPSDDTLVIEAKISPRDIAFLRPGQRAIIKFTAYDFTIFGGLNATLTHISADSILDEQTGNTFYLVRLKTDETALDGDLPIIVGMTTQVDILTGKKTLLNFLLKPVLRASRNALTER